MGANAQLQLLSQKRDLPLKILRVTCPTGMDGSSFGSKQLQVV